MRLVIGGLIRFHAYGGILSIEERDTPDSEREIPVAPSGPVQKPPSETSSEGAEKN